MQRFRILQRTAQLSQQLVGDLSCSFWQNSSTLTARRGIQIQRKHPSPSVRPIKTYVVNPPRNPETPRLIHLNSWDTAMLSMPYMQKGLLFKNPPDLSVEKIIERLKSSLQEALCHFYPLTGRLRFDKCDMGGVTCHVETGCEGEGAEFVHAVADGIGIIDLVASEGQDLPEILKEFFPLNLAVNFDGSTNPLLTVQVTMLTDGFFVGCAFNHTIGDGTSLWMFFNAWAEIARCKAIVKEVVLSQPPGHNKWFIGDYGEPPIKLPYSSPSECVVQFTPPPLRERMFHFSSGSLAKLKARANQECGKGKVSTFQALSALMWRCITRARRFSPEQNTCFILPIENRARLQPPLPPNYFGNSMNIVGTTTTVGELLHNNLGWAASQLHKIVANHTDSAIRDNVHKYMTKPTVLNMQMLDIYHVLLTSSPRFDMYGCDFGWGKALAALGGTSNKFDGGICSYPGWEGDGSIDLEVCLLPDNMCALERDEEFLAVVSPPVEFGVLLATSSRLL